MALEFKPIDLTKDLDVCIRFRRDSYAISFGNLDGFEADVANYVARMEKKLATFPQGNCHLWLDGAIIGQTEMKLVNDPEVGYVSFFYLAPAMRGLGYGEALHLRAVDEFTAIGKRKLQLSVSSSNARAIRFYTKMGWTNLWPRPDKPHVFLMAFELKNTL